MHLIFQYELPINVINIQDYINYWECLLPTFVFNLCMFHYIFKIFAHSGSAFLLEIML